ncbi:MAG: PilZ domain-containing protein [Deltaproteobacteria bacterium]|nr:PilZ domain-containing protein [Deltaproteobacteria bacterium]
MIEQRRHARAPIDIDVTFSVKGRGEVARGRARDISVGGMFVETATPGAFGTEVIIHALLPGASEPLALPGIVRWVRDGGMGVQFGLLGAIETHVITEIKRQHDERQR